MASVRTKNDSPTASHPSPPFRRFVALELPFTVSPPACTHTARLRACIESFLPPATLAPILSEAHDADTRRAEALEKEEAEEEEKQEKNDGEATRTNHAPDTPSLPPAPPIRSRSDNGKGGVRLCLGDPQAYRAEPVFSCWRNVDWEECAAAGRPAEPWPLWGMAAPHPPSDCAASGNANRDDDGCTAQTPQLLLHGFYRNDVLVRVRCAVRRRRVRCRRTARLVLDDTDSDDDGGDDGGDGGHRRGAATEVRVVGVVSRELAMTRPADWCCAAPPRRAAPRRLAARYARDLYPPRHFADARTPFEVRYEMGRSVNTSALVQPARDAAAALSVNDGGATALAEWCVIPSVVVQPMCAAAAPATAADRMPTRLPPEMPAVQREFLTRLGAEWDDMPGHGAVRELGGAGRGGSPNGPLGGRAPHPAVALRLTNNRNNRNNGTGTPELQCLHRLLARRPVWLARELLQAMLRTGQCPRLYHNKQLMNCLTYVIATGPFNRLRVRWDYDPYACPTSAVYQRVAMKYARRGEVGVLLRDVARSPHVRLAVQIVRQRHRTRRSDTEPPSSPLLHADATPRGGGDGGDGDGDGTQRVAAVAEEGGGGGSMTELLCRVALRGSLYVTFQLIDALDDAVFAEALRRVMAQPSPAAAHAPPVERESRGGWLTESVYQRLCTHFTERLRCMLSEEIVPLLRMFAGRSSGAGGGDGVVGAKDGGESPRPVEKNARTRRGAEKEEEEEDGHASGVAESGSSGDEKDG